jgi:hypothetical protein
MSTEIYVNSENRVTLTDLTNQSDSSLVTDATVAVTLYDFTARKFLNRAAAVNATGGLVDLPLSAHGYSVGDFILLTGDDDYEAEYEIQTGTATDTIRVTATFVAKTFTGKEQVIKAVDNARNISMTDGTGGDYAGNIPDTVKLILNHEYWAVVSATSGTNNAEFKQTWKAVYKG